MHTFAPNSGSRTQKEPGATQSITLDGFTGTYCGGQFRANEHPSPDYIKCKLLCLIVFNIRPWITKQFFTFVLLRCCGVRPRSILSRYIRKNKRFLSVLHLCSSNPFVLWQLYANVLIRQKFMANLTGVYTF